MSAVNVVLLLLSAGKHSKYSFLWEFIALFVQLQCPPATLPAGAALFG